MAVFGSGNIWSLGASGGGGGVSSVENGLYLASGVARLGGALIENTVIDLAGFYLQIGGADNYFRIEKDSSSRTVTTWRYPAGNARLYYDGQFNFDRLVRAFSSVSNDYAKIDGNTGFAHILSTGENAGLGVSIGQTEWTSTENTFKIREGSRAAARVQFDFSDSNNDVTLSLFSAAGSYSVFQQDAGNVFIDYVADKIYRIRDGGAKARLNLTSSVSDFYYPSGAAGLNLQAAQGRLYAPASSHYFEAGNNWVAGKVSTGGAVVRMFTAESRDDKFYIRANDLATITNQPNRSITFRLDETANNLIIYAKYSTGAAKVGTVALV